MVDAVVHPYNLAPANQNPKARDQLEAVYGAHVLATDQNRPEYLLTHDEFFSDFPFEAIADSLFVESPVDLAVIHALPNLGFARGHVTAPERAAAFRDRYPDRFRLFATVDTPITQLEQQVTQFGVDGLKLYPAFFYDDVGRGWRLDDADYATPLLEAARDLGIRNVAVHKALWLPPAPRSAFSLDDLDLPLERFPDINFHVVHAGAAFLEETATLLRRHRNLYATLESVFAYVVVRPLVFAKILGTLLRACGADQLMFGSGSNLSHPAPLLAAFDGYELPDDLVAEHGYPQLTAEDRRGPPRTAEDRRGPPRTAAGSSAGTRCACSASTQPPLPAASRTTSSPASACAVWPGPGDSYARARQRYGDEPPGRACAQSSSEERGRRRGAEPTERIGGPVNRTETAAPTEERIREALRSVPEPCGLLMRTPIDICEMGLVDEIECHAGNVRVVLVLTDTSCVHFSGLKRYITDVLTALPGVESVEVTVSTTQLWTPDRRQPAPGSPHPP
ncbi:amidohydrolase family protein [Candidatus Protofrankia datiscae]|uniref:amidohydrolase family protein n=1 Tax=Candidatus Protofrankia datiscae TaxID=2716812 RepID=UPI0005BCFC54|nr:amidohydrolase family protein [Candidatus Protofrankia datiscae]